MQNTKEYLNSTLYMLPGLIAYNNQDYIKWLTDILARMVTLPKVQLDFFPLTFLKHSISQSLPYSCVSLDRDDNESIFQAK